MLAGTIHALAVTGAKRSDLLPKWKEQPGMHKLNAALNAALATDEVRARLALEGAEAQPTTPEDYAAIIDREVTMWSDLVKAAGIKPE